MLSRNLLTNNTPSEAQRQNAEHLIRVNDVVKAYKTEAGDFLALKNVNLTIGRGEFVGIIGKSGSGKSTLINMITGIDRPTKGEVNVGGVAIHNLNEGDMAKHVFIQEIVFGAIERQARDFALQAHLHVLEIFNFGRHEAEGAENFDTTRVIGHQNRSTIAGSPDKIRPTGRSAVLRA